MTASALSISPEKPVTRSTSPMPLRISDPNSAANPAANPPAAAPPAREITSTPRSRRKTSCICAAPASSTATISGDAPFCGANICAAPSVPVNVPVTSQRQTNSSARMLSGTSERSTAATSSSVPPSGSISSPFASKKRTPSAAAAPSPRSLVALPPRQSRIRRTPSPAAVRIICPTP